jgi:hypothetical protein
VLISGRKCGNITYVLGNGPEATAGAWTDYYSARTQKASEYLSYAYKCYQNPDAPKSKECEIYTKGILPYTKNASASCPFDDAMCILPRGNLILDTGYLDSLHYLGLNSGPRFQLRLERHCAPLDQRNHTDVVTDESDPSIQWMRYFYGANLDGKPYSYRLRLNDSKTPLNPDDLMIGADYTIT